MYSVDRACTVALRIIERNEVPSYAKPEDSPALKSIIVSDSIRSSVLFHRKWALRPPYGRRMGMNFVGPFEDDIRTMILRYCLDKGQKLSCNQIQEQICLSYPTLFDIPATHHITSKVNKWLHIFRAARKKGIVLEGVQDEIRKRKKYILFTRTVSRAWLGNTLQ